MKTLRTHTMAVSPEAASLLLESNKYQYQRIAHKAHMSRLASMMSNGEWLPGSSIRLAIAPNGDGSNHTFLVDGQHRLMAVVQSGTVQSFEVTEIWCENMVEVGELYSAIDRGRQRGINDVYRTQHLEEEFGLTSTAVRTFGGAARLIACDFGRDAYAGQSSFSDKDRLTAMRSLREGAEMYFDLVSECAVPLRPHLHQNTSVAAVGIVICQDAVAKFGEKKIADFWQGLAANEPGGKDTRRTLITHLTTTRVSTNSGVGKIVSRGARVHAVALCWNAWAEDRYLSFVRVLDAGSTPYIKGTRFGK